MFLAGVSEDGGLFCPEQEGESSDSHQHLGCAEAVE